MTHERLIKALVIARNSCDEAIPERPRVRHGIATSLALLAMTLV